MGGKRVRYLQKVNCNKFGLQIIKKSSSFAAVKSVSFHRKKSIENNFTWESQSLGLAIILGNYLYTLWFEIQTCFSPSTGFPKIFKAKQQLFSLPWNPNAFISLKLENRILRLFTTLLRLMLFKSFSQSRLTKKLLHSRAQDQWWPVYKYIDTIGFIRIVNALIDYDRSRTL